MAKVRIEIVPEFGPNKGKVLTGVVVEPEYDALLKVAICKLQIKKKDAAKVSLHCSDFTGTCFLPHGDLSAVVHNGAKIQVCLDEPQAASVAQQMEQPKLSKKVANAVDQLCLVEVTASGGALSARGRPGLETLAALQRCKGVTGIVTLLRHDECQGAAAAIGQACERLELKWCHAPLAGPKQMGMIGLGKASVTAEDLESFRKVQQVKEWLESGGEKLVVHCAAGLHRTGMFLYVLLRLLGHPADDTLARIQLMRQETHDEFIYLKFQAKAEAIFTVVTGSAQGASPDVIDVVAAGAEGQDGGEAEEDCEEVE